MKRILFLLLTIGVGLNASAIEIIMSSNQKMISDAVSTAIFFVETPYNIKDSTGQVFGRKHSSFNRSYTMGVCVKDGWVLHTDALFPWKADKDFARYNATHQPVLLPSCIYEIDGALKDSLMLDASSMKTEKMGGEFYCIKNKHLHGTHGLKIDTAKAEAGWLMLLVSKDEISKKDSATVVNKLIYKKSLDFSTSDTCGLGNTPMADDDYLWGGLWLIPRSDGMGSFSFTLGGICVRQGDKWYISRVAKDEQPEELVVQETIPVEKTDTIPSVKKGICRCRKHIKTQKVE